MGLRKSKGNMYPWVTHTHSHLGGECPHACSYCSIRSMAEKYPNVRERYSGPVRLIESEFDVKYGKGKTIFVENCNDLFAGVVDPVFTEKILTHCREWPKNLFIYQTKNPVMVAWYLDSFPPDFILGTTIETNRDTYPVSLAPSPGARIRAMAALDDLRRFITIEPIMDFDVNILSDWILRINPEFVNIGADSKGHHLPEPTMEKVEALIGKLKGAGIEIREKKNLDRLKGFRTSASSVESLKAEGGQDED